MGSRGISRPIVAGRGILATAMRVPLTLTLMSVVTGLAVAGGALDGGTPEATIARWGFSLNNLGRGRLLTPFTADFLVDDAAHLRAILAMAALFVGSVEWLAGSRLAALAFWLGSLGGSLLTALLVKTLGDPLAWHPDRDLVVRADVGASVGAWGAAGALGVLAGRFPAVVAWPLRAGLAGLVILLAVQRHGAADVAHLAGFGVGIAVATVWTRRHPLTRPLGWRARSCPAERERARALIARHGDSSLDLFKTWPDKEFFFAGAGADEGVVAYGVALSTAVALGDPVVPDPAAFRTVLRAFLDFCDGNGWRVAFHQVAPAHLADYQAVGLTALKMGEAARVDLERFSLEGHAMKSLRSAIKRFEREGYRTVYHPAPLPDLTLIGLRAVSDEWLTIGGRRERRFSLGRWDDAYVRSTAVMTVEDAAGRVYAFANLIPDGVAGEATVDLTRRRPDAPNAVMDYLFVALFEHARAAGFARFSLGMTPFAEVGARPCAPALERGLGLLARRLDRFLAVKGLLAYKDKFGPAWEARYLVYPSAAALPIVALALLRLTEGSPADRAGEKPFPA